MFFSLLLLQCPTCLLRLTRKICEMEGMWPYSCYFLGRCFRDLFKIARSILVLSPSNYFSIHFVSVHVHPYSCIDTAKAWKKSLFILSDRSDSHMVDESTIVVNAFTKRTLTSRSIDEILLLRYVNLSINFRGMLLRVEMAL